MFSSSYFTSIEQSLTTTPILPYFRSFSILWELVIWEGTIFNPLSSYQIPSNSKIMNTIYFRLQKLYTMFSTIKSLEQHLLLLGMAYIVISKLYSPIISLMLWCTNRSLLSRNILLVDLCVVLFLARIRWAYFIASISFSWFFKKISCLKSSLIHPCKIPINAHNLCYPPSWPIPEVMNYNLQHHLSAWLFSTN